VKANYGDAGTTQGRTAESEIGGYSKGDYGAGGTVEPVRKPAPILRRSTHQQCPVRMFATPRPRVQGPKD
jgi:hypothetical protein